MGNWDHATGRFNANLEKAKVEIAKERELSEIIDLKTLHNDQIDNKTFPHIQPGGQCGYTSCAMFLSTFMPEAITDDFISKLIIKMDSGFIAGSTNVRKGAYQRNYNTVINEFLRPLGFKSIAIESGGTHEQIIEILKKGFPLFTSTMLTSEGHYVLIRGFCFKTNNYIVNDPYGLFQFSSRKYIKIGKGSGSGVLYDKIEFEKVMDLSSKAATGKNGFRYIYPEKII